MEWDVGAKRGLCVLRLELILTIK